MNGFTTKNPLSRAKVIGADVKREDYCRQAGDVRRGDPLYVMSRSELTEFNHCPARWLAGYVEKDSKAMDWGTLIDELILSGGAQNLAVTPEFYTSEKGETKPWNWNANVCKKWREDRAGLSVVDHDDFEDAQAAITAITRDPAIADMLKGAKKQVMVIAEFQDEDTGIAVPIKTLIDIVPDVGGRFGRSLADLKTCANAQPRAWRRAVFEHGYHIQGALYLDAYTKATGEDRQDFRHVLQESYKPWQIGRRVLSAEFLELGRVSYIAALKRYCQCLKSGQWDDYETGEKMILDGFALTEPESWMVGA